LGFELRILQRIAPYRQRRLDALLGDVDRGAGALALSAGSLPRPFSSAVSEPSLPR
jgi:hypothetical protein